MGILRLYLALAVVIAHSHPIFGLKSIGGLIAVQTFYMISGFYMAMILNTKYVGTGSYRLFLSNRFLRIFPAYWAVLGLTLLARSAGFQSFGYGWNSVASGHAFPTLTAVYVFAANLLIFGQDLLLFLGMNQQGRLYPTANFLETDPRLYTFLFVPQAWSLGVELTFYLVAPLLVRKRLRIVVAIIAASLALLCFLAFHLGLSDDPWIYRFFPTELALFLAGSVSFRAFQFLENRNFSSRRASIAAICFLALTVSFEFLPKCPGRGVSTK